ncbi:unnamed protein product, partial [Ixodes persulcatus]
RTWGPAHVHLRGPVLRDGDLRALDKPVHGLQTCRSSHAAPPEAPKRASGWPVTAAPRRGGGHSTGVPPDDSRQPSSPGRASQLWERRRWPVGTAGRPPTRRGWLHRVGRKCCGLHRSFCPGLSA